MMQLMIKIASKPQQFAGPAMTVAGIFPIKRERNQASYADGRELYILYFIFISLFGFVLAVGKPSAVDCTTQSTVMGS